MDSETGKILLPQYKGTIEEFEALEPEEQEKYVGEDLWHRASDHERVSE